MPVKQMNESPIGLQNLAWLGEDGKVHTVKQPENGQRLIGSSGPMVGGAMPVKQMNESPLGLQNLVAIPHDWYTYDKIKFENGWLQNLDQDAQLQMIGL